MDCCWAEGSYPCSFCGMQYGVTHLAWLCVDLWHLRPQADLDWDLEAWERQEVSVPPHELFANCILSGTIGIAPARGNGSASAIRAVRSHDDKSTSLVASSILGVSNGSGLFRSNRIAGPTCPNKEVWILAMLYVMFYVVISKISVCLFACLVVTT